MGRSLGFDARIIAPSAWRAQNKLRRILSIEALRGRRIS
jgi:hypothetical protein